MNSFALIANFWKKKKNNWLVEFKILIDQIIFIIKIVNLNTSICFSHIT